MHCRDPFSQNNRHRHPIVLVHGGWAGGWQWREVAEKLTAASFSVFTPTLTGLGERVHLASPEVGLSTYITDIEKVLFYEQLSEAVLVGFSFSGLIISGVAERVPERISCLVYLDAFVPANGQSLEDIVGPKISKNIRSFASQYGDGWRIPSFFDNNPRSTPQPLKTSEEPVTIENPRAQRIPHVYIHCTAKPTEWVFTPILDRCAEYARDQGWEYRKLDSDHFPMYSAREQLVAELIEITDSL